MNRISRMAAAALAVTLSLSLALPANASESAFTWLGCAGQPTSTTGSVSTYSAGTRDAEAWHGSVFGSLFPCRQPVESDVFAIASYDSDGVATALATRYGELESFLAEVVVRPQTIAVCLIDNYKNRLDCIKISWYEPESGPPQPYDGGHLPVDSPQVQALPAVTYSGVVIHPGCPTCV